MLVLDTVTQFKAIKKIGRLVGKSTELSSAHATAQYCQALLARPFIHLTR
jgi:hypothetical protein